MQMNVRLLLPAVGRIAPQTGVAQRPEKRAEAVPGVGAALSRQLQEPASPARTTARRQRLALYTVRTTSALQGTVEDSTFFFYNSASRGAAHHSRITASYYQYNAPYRSGRIIDARGDAYIQPDSVYTRNGRSPYRTAVSRFYYNPQNRQVRSASYDSGVAVSQSFFYRSTGETIDSGTRTAGGAANPANPSLPHPAAYRVINRATRYTTSGLPRVDSLNNYSTPYVLVTQLTYDSQDRLRARYVRHGNQTDTVELTAFTYNSLGLLETAASWSPVSEPGIGVQPTAKDSFAYTGGEPCYTFRETSFRDGVAKALRAYERETVQLTSAGAPATKRLWLRDAPSGNWRPYLDQAFGYNSANNLQVLQSYYVDTAGIFPTTPTNSESFFYETYEPAGVEVPADPASYAVAPNPARTCFTISAPPGSKCATIQLMDAFGRPVAEGRLEAGQLNTAVSAGDLPRGLYFLVLQQAGMPPYPIRVLLE